MKYPKLKLLDLSNNNSIQTDSQVLLEIDFEMRKRGVD